MLNSYLKESEFFFKFLLDVKATRNQKKALLLNLSRNQLKAIIEIIHNFLENHYIKISPQLTKALQQHHILLTKFVTLPKKFHAKQKFMQRHYKIVYSILLKGKETILFALTK